MKKRIFIIVLTAIFITVFSAEAQSNPQSKKALGQKNEELKAVVDHFQSSPDKNKAQVNSPQSGTFQIGSTIENDDRKVTFNSANISDKLIELNFTIENTGSSDIKIVSFLNFRAENNAGVDLTNDSFSCEGITIDGSVIPGGKLSGSVCFKTSEPAPYRVYYQPGWAASPDDFMWAVSSEPGSANPEPVEIPAEKDTLDSSESGSSETRQLFVFQNNLVNQEPVDTGNQVTIETENQENPVETDTVSSGSIFDKFLLRPDTTPVDNTVVQLDNNIEPVSGINMEKQQLLNNVQTTFPYVAINEENWGVYGGQDDIGGGETFINRFENGIYHSILSASTPLSDSDSYGFFIDPDLGLFRNFALHTDVTLSDVRPTGSYGDCYVSYTDINSVDEGQTKWFDVEVGYDIDTYDSTSDDTKTWYDLSSYGELGKNYSIDVIRMNGIASIFIDGVYIGEVEDGITEKVTMWLGTFIGSDSQYVDCAFDNFEIRTQ
ncbi:MAG: hypothetical protein AB9907_01695 [Flexilinea sp.]